MIDRSKALEVARTLHPCTWGIVAGFELLAVCLAVNRSMSSVLLLGNVFLTAMLSEPRMYSPYVKNIVGSCAWGMTFLTLMHCPLIWACLVRDKTTAWIIAGAVGVFCVSAFWSYRSRLWHTSRLCAGIVVLNALWRCPALTLEVVWPCEAGVIVTLSRILFGVSIVALLATAINPDRLFICLVSHGMPLWLYQTASRAAGLLNEIATAASDAFDLQQLSGRSVRSVRDRARMLLHIVRASFFRTLLEHSEGGPAQRSRLQQSAARPQFAMENRFKTGDIVMLLSSGSLLLLLLVM